MVKVRLFADLKDALDGRSEVYVKLDSVVTLKKLIERLINEFDGRLRGKIFQSVDKLGEDVIVLVNRKLVKSLDTEICEKDEVAFLPPVSGG